MKKHPILLKKALVLFLSLIILSSLMCACQRKQAQEDELTENSTSITETNQTVNTPKWKTAYLDFLEAEKDTHLSYALVYIDNDDIPELYLSGANEATGDSICAYKNGVVIEQWLHRIGGGWYVERSGTVFNKNGHMGQMHTHAYKLNEVGFELTFEALSSERLSEDLETGEPLLYYEYSIGDKPVTESEYNAAVKAAFDFDNSVHLRENSVDYDTIRQQIIDFN